MRMFVADSGGGCLRSEVKFLRDAVDPSSVPEAAPSTLVDLSCPSPVSIPFLLRRKRYAREQVLEKSIAESKVLSR